MVSSKTMHPTREDVEDAEKILGEFSLGRVRNIVENQEFSTVRFNQILEKLKPETAKAISVGDDKRELISAHESVQYGTKSFSLEVEGTSNVFDNFCFWELPSYEDDLSGEVVSLLGRADPAVADDSRGTSPTDVGSDIVETLSCFVPYVNDSATIRVLP
jgi:hypothetical protein